VTTGLRIPSEAYVGRPDNSEGGSSLGSRCRKKAGNLGASTGDRGQALHPYGFAIGPTDRHQPQPRGSPPERDPTRPLKGPIPEKRPRDSNHVDREPHWTVRQHYGGPRASFESLLWVVVGLPWIARKKGCVPMQRPYEGKSGRRRVWASGERTGTGERYWHIWLRTDRVLQKSWLHQVEKTKDTACTCGHPREDGDHVTFACPRFHQERGKLIGLSSVEGARRPEISQGGVRRPLRPGGNLPRLLIHPVNRKIGDRDPPGRHVELARREGDIPTMRRGSDMIMRGGPTKGRGGGGTSPFVFEFL